MVRRLIEQGLKPSETTTFFAPSRIEHYRVVPLKLALNQLELKLSQVSAKEHAAGVWCWRGQRRRPHGEVSGFEGQEMDNEEIRWVAWKSTL